MSESNVNRQVQALGSTLGMAKVEALRARIADIHPGCDVHGGRGVRRRRATGPALLPRAGRRVVDACDDGRAKAALAAWARRTGTPLVIVGAAGGKRAAERVEVADLADVTPRPDARRAAPAPAQAPRRRRARARSASRCVFSREPVVMPAGDDEACDVDGSLNCHGYGSSVAVTATFGMVAAARALEFAALRRRPAEPTRRLIIMGSEGC